MTTEQFIEGYSQRFNSSRTLTNPLDDHPEMVSQLISMKEGYEQSEEGEFRKELETQIIHLFYEIERLTGTDPCFAEPVDA